MIFDFDGVLANSEPLHLAAFQQVLARIGVTLSAEEYYARYLGFSDLDAFRHVGRDRGIPLDATRIDELMEIKQELFPQLLGDHALYAGAAECLARVAAEVPVAIASGALRAEIELMLERGGLEGRVPVIVAAGETPRSKPHPDPYARALERLCQEGHLPQGTDPTLVVAIEDSEWGLQSARGAGLRTVGLTTSYPKERLPSAELTLDDIEAVTLPILQSLVARPPARSTVRA